MDSFTKSLLLVLMVAGAVSVVGACRNWIRRRAAQFENPEAARRSIAKSIARHYRKTGDLPEAELPPVPAEGARVLREKNDGTFCFSVVQLPSTEQVMISIAGGELKIFKMSIGGTVPTATLWESSDSDEIAAAFFNETRPHEHPLESARNRVLTLRSTEEMAAW